jgi:cytochrome c oxidase assembly protein subunit 15
MAVIISDPIISDPIISDPLTAGGSVPARRIAADRTLVRFWLYGVMLVLFALVLVGGATRLTDSGLSITEWKPIHGVIPPLSEAEWQEELEKYRQIPEYQQINKGMSLEEFKVIYWWEWAHRILARGVGVVFAVPLFIFWAMGRIEPHLKPKLLGLLALGGFQGFIGWWMVSSGLTERTDVSQYRLATHLTIAALIFAGLMAVARSLAPHSQGPATDATRRGAGWLAILVIAQIYLGGLVAGLDAGLTYTTWPLMDESIIPSGLFDLSPWWANLFENPLTVQFIHRGGAYLLFALVIIHAVRVWARDGADSTHARRALVLAALVTLQGIIGISTLLMFVPMPMALLHQGTGFLLLGFAVAHWQGAKGQMRLPGFA